MDCLRVHERSVSADLKRAGSGDEIAYVMNEQTHKNGQQNLLKNVIQISVSLCLKAKRLPLANRGAVWLSTFMMSIYHVTTVLKTKHRTRMLHDVVRAREQALRDVALAI